MTLNLICNVSVDQFRGLQPNYVLFFHRLFTVQACVSKVSHFYHFMKVFVLINTL